MYGVVDIIGEGIPAPKWRRLHLHKQPTLPVKRLVTGQGLSPLKMGVKGTALDQR